MSTYEFQGFHIPEHMMGGLRRWIDHGIEPGSFLWAVICNDLREAVGRADRVNMANLPAYVSYLYNEAPAQCWGSPEKAGAWMAIKESDQRAAGCGQATA